MFHLKLINLFYIYIYNNNNNFDITMMNHYEVNVLLYHKWDFYL